MLAMIGLGSLALLLFAIPWDVYLVEHVSGFFSPGTVQRKLLTVQSKLIGWPTHAIVFILLAIHPQRKRALPAYGCTLACLVASIHLLKFLFGRARPELGFGAWEFRLFGDPLLDLDSFPSGHATEAFFLALYVGILVPRLRMTLLMVAGMISLGRIAQERHFATDIFAGAALATGWIMLAVFYWGCDALPRLTRAALADGWSEIKFFASSRVSAIQRPRE